jgi:hypothetical protein
MQKLKLIFWIVSFYACASYGANEANSAENQLEPAAKKREVVYREVRNSADVFVGVGTGLCGLSPDGGYLNGQFMYGFTANVFGSIHFDYCEKSTAAIIIGSSLNDNKKYLASTNSKDFSIGGDLRYLGNKFAPSGIRPMLGLGFTSHNYTIDAAIDNDNETLKKEYSYTYKRSDSSLDLIAGLATQYTPELMLFWESRLQVVMGQKWNRWNLGVGAAIKL